MKLLTFTFIALFAIHTTFAVAEDAATDWMTYYYKNPTPDKFVEKVRMMAKDESLTNPGAQPPILAFLSQLMASNPKKISEWLDALADLDDQQRSLLLAAVWYSGTEEARAYLESCKLEKYLKEKAPKILEMEVNSPPVLDMLWGCFMATGDEKPIRRIVTAFNLAKYAGALKRFKMSEKTEQDKKEAYWDATFQAAQWSLESNCHQHPAVLRHCEAIVADPALPREQRLWLSTVLTKVKSEKQNLELNNKKDD